MAFVPCEGNFLEPIVQARIGESSGLLEENKVFEDIEIIQLTHKGEDNARGPQLRLRKFDREDKKRTPITPSFTG